MAPITKIMDMQRTSIIIIDHSIMISAMVLLIQVIKWPNRTITIQPIIKVYHRRMTWLMK